MTKAKHRIFVDSFTSLDGLKGKDRSDPIKVLSVLKKCGQFSTFEMSECRKLQKAWGMIEAKGWAEFKGPSRYPWHDVRITEAGKKVLQAWV